MIIIENSAQTENSFVYVYTVHRNCRLKHLIQGAALGTMQLHSTQ